jgi:hypothetical protein
MTDDDPFAPPRAREATVAREPVAPGRLSATVLIVQTLGLSVCEGLLGERSFAAGSVVGIATLHAVLAMGMRFLPRLFGYVAPLGTALRTYLSANSIWHARRPTTGR